MAAKFGGFKMSEWQLIETAPKDGTVILLAGGEDDNFRFVGDNEQGLCRAPCRAKWYKEDGWIMTFAEAGYVAVCRINPTHWMKLPDPPVEA